MREVNRTAFRSKRILHSQGKLIIGYISSLIVLSAAIVCMPTDILIWNLKSGRIYGHSILFWISIVSASFFFTRFKKGNTYFKKYFPTECPPKTFSLFRNKGSKNLAVITAITFLLLLILSLVPISTFPRFILFAICSFLLGLYLGLNSYEYRIYHIHSKYTYRLPKKSQIRRDENVENHQS